MVVMVVGSGRDILSSIHLSDCRNTALGKPTKP